MSTNKSTVDGMPKSAVYIGIGAAALAVAYFLHHKTTAPITPVAQSSSVPVVSSGFPEPTTASTGASAGGSNTTSTLTNDTQWATQAIAALTSQGVSPGNAQALVFNYLKGQALSIGNNVADAAALMAAVVSSLGAPPDTTLSDADIYQAVYGYVPSGVSVGTGSANTSGIVTGTAVQGGSINPSGSIGSAGTQLVTSGGVAGGAVGVGAPAYVPPTVPGGIGGGVTGIG